MSKTKNHIAVIVASRIVNSDNRQYVHLRNDIRRPKPNEFKILDDVLYISKLSVNAGVVWVKYDA